MRMWKHDQFLDEVVLLDLLLLAATGWAFLPASGAGGARASFGQAANDLAGTSRCGDAHSVHCNHEVQIYDANPVVLRTGISFIVGTANEDLPYLANPALATAGNIIVGNEIFSGTNTSLMNQG